MAPSSTLRADALPHVPTPSYTRGNVNHEGFEVTLGKGSASDPSSNEYWSSRMLPSILLPHHNCEDRLKASAAISSNGLSPFGPHISTNKKNIWTRHGIYPCPIGLVDDNCSSTGSPERFKSEDFSRHSQQQQANYGDYGCRSTGKDLLRSDSDDGWNDVEAALNSVLNMSQFHANAPEDVAMDSLGRREITRDALINEMMRFSRVLRLETFMEIFKVNTFDRLVEFIHCLMTFCSIQSDPIFGYMVIPKGHLYVPARKMTISPRASLHPLGFASSKTNRRLFPPIPAQSKAPSTKVRKPPPLPILAIKMSNTQIQRRVGPVKHWPTATVDTSNKENASPKLPNGQDFRKVDRPWRVDTLPPTPQIFHAAFSDYGKRRDNRQTRVKTDLTIDTFSKRNALYAN